MTPRYRRHAWLRKIQVGDILYRPGHPGSERVVRAVVVHNKSIAGHVHITFAIRRCSWTRRCFTTLNATDLLDRGYRPTGHRMRLNKPMDKRIAEAANRRSAEWRKRDPVCCDVEGVP